MRIKKLNEDLFKSIPATRREKVSFGTWFLQIDFYHTLTVNFAEGRAIVKENRLWERPPFGRPTITPFAVVQLYLK